MGRRGLALGALLLFLAQAWRSDGYYNPDEYWQVVEFASYKLGRTPASELAWEFQARARPYLQPAVYAAVAQGLARAGFPEPHVALLGYRVLGALLAWVALCVLALGLGARLTEEGQRRWLLAGCLLTWYVPFLSVRMSSESVSGSLLALGLGTWLVLPGRPLLAAVGSGLWMGLSFGVRYQTALAVVGFLAWLVLGRRARVPVLVAFTASVLGAVAFGLVVDRWGYGDWNLVPWNYLRINLLEGFAATFGREPITFYVTSLLGWPLREPALPPCPRCSSSPWWSSGCALPGTPSPG
jgi:phosphatidylinositol glycan class B